MLRAPFLNVVDAGSVRRGACDNDITQRSPIDAARVRVGRLVHRTQTALMLSIDAALSPYGITTMQLVILAAVHKGDADTATGLCRRIPCSAGAMTRLLDRLQEKGLIVRSMYEGDRRAHKLALSEEARGMLPMALKTSDAVLSRILRGFYLDELQQLESLLFRTNAPRAGR
jgi:DNA-binding MarR family transcriptional regulator